ncbi:MAG: hypothetical protein LH614_15850 [Pyrinomonadaceae bacterium]|nr:hypothetical protein [Pyrinomonadaceae bacterium]
MTEVIGWVSSIILFLTVSRQIYKQWQAGTSEGVSMWLFAGQIAASLGFAVYSWLLWNPVFIFTNILMVLNGIVGFAISLYLKKQDSSETDSPDQKTEAETAASF